MKSADYLNARNAIMTIAKKFERTEILSVRDNDNTYRVYRVVASALNMSCVEYHVNAYHDEFENEKDYCFYNETFQTLSLAFADLHRFIMCEYSTSVYATDDDDESAYASFR